MRYSHIVYIITKLELGGAQKVCLSLFEGFSKSSNGASLISGTDGTLVFQVQDNDNVYLIKSLKREVGLKSIFKEFKSLREIIRTLREIKERYKNVIVHTHSTKAGIIGRWAALFAGIKKRVHTVHGFGFHNNQSWFQWMIHYFLEIFTSLITTKYVCVSQSDIETGKKFLPCFAKKSLLIRAAVKCDDFLKNSSSQFKLTHQVFIFGTISCFKPQKNLLDMFKAFKKTYDVSLNKNIKLEIIGDGVLRSILEKWIDDNDMQNKILLLGWKKEVSFFLHKWDVYVMSSLWEGLPCSIVEARLCKLPVIAYDVGGISEFIYHGKNGFLVSCGNWQQICHFMKIFKDDHGVYKKCSSYDDNFFPFHNETMINQHASLYAML